MTYYDPAPLLEAAERAVLRCERHPMSVAASPDAATANELAGVLGVANRTVVRWRNGGQVPGRMVDDLATRIGYHPASLWPDWVDEALVPCANDRCDNRFVPSRKGHRFCSASCGSAAWGRRKWATDPEWRARKLAAIVEYDDECAEARRAAKRRRYAADAERRREYARAYYAANRDKVLARRRSDKRLAS